MRPGCIYQHTWKRLGTTTHCCRACELGQKGSSKFHTKNCTGARKHIRNNYKVNDRKYALASTTSRSRSRHHRSSTWLPTSFTMPYMKTRFNLRQSTVAAVESLANMHGFVLTTYVRDAWLRAQTVIERMAMCRVQLYVHICTLNNIPSFIAQHCMDVDKAYPLNAESTEYTFSEVTGANPRVQAHLVTQPLTAKVIEEATIYIETQRSFASRRIAFACKSGTHHSMACGCLLLSLVYPQSILIPCSERTHTDARIWMSTYSDCL